MEQNEELNSKIPISENAVEVGLKIGQILTLEIGPVAHGGHFIARHEGRVIFVRHAITGETARVQLTQVTSKISRGDAIEILQSSPNRRSSPCKYATPGGCGGCDFQHIEIGYQRELKALIIKEQFARLAKIDIDVKVLGVDPIDGLHWRSRMDFAVSPTGHLGLFGSRSNEVVQIDDCLIAVTDMQVPKLAARKWSGEMRVEVAASNTHQVNVFRGGRNISGPTRLLEQVGNHSFEISPLAFWQSHTNAPTALLNAALEAMDLQYGDHVCDLYAGVGLFTAEISRQVGESGKVHLIESDRKAVDDAERIFKEKKNVTIHRGTVESKLPKISRVDVILLDPPRTGAGEMVITSILQQKPRTIVYVSCDPAAMARDTKFLLDGGYRLDHIVGFDLFPMTQHVETVAQFNRQK